MKLIAIEEHFLTPEVKVAWLASPIVDDSDRLCPSKSLPDCQWDVQ